MPGAFTQAFRAERHGTEKEELLSLAFVDYAALTALDVDGPGTSDQIFATYIGQYWNYSACHDIAAKLIQMLDSGAGQVVTDTATGGNAILAARNAVNAGNRAIKFDYGYHSFTLVVHNGAVDSLEGWAGGPPGCDGVRSLPIYSSIFSDNRKDMAPDDVRAAIADIRDNSDDTRTAALDVLSQGGLYGFESGQGRKDLRVTVAQLDTTVNVRTRLRTQMNTAKEWVSRVQAEVMQKAVCWECFTVRSSPWLGWQSTAITRWHQCRACARTYCASCGKGFDHHATQGWNEYRERECPRTACGGRTRLI
jgi:hypothetical protein